MRLTVLGCAGTFAGPESCCSSYLVEHDGFRLVVDMGNGALGSLQRFSDLMAVDAVLLSHLHADHCIDLISYYYARRYNPVRVPPPLDLYGPKGTVERLCGGLGHAPDDLMAMAYRFHETAEGRWTIGPFEIDLVPMVHPIESHAMRISAGGRQLVYSSDTAINDDLVELARGADLLLCEASWLESPDNPPAVHMSAAEAGQVATRAGVDRLVLTHIVPWVTIGDALDEARSTYAGGLEAAATGAVYDV